MNFNKSIKVTLTRAERFYFYQNQNQFLKIIKQNLKRLKNEKKELLGK